MGKHIQLCRGLYKFTGSVTDGTKPSCAFNAAGIQVLQKTCGRFESWNLILVLRAVGAVMTI